MKPVLVLAVGAFATAVMMSGQQPATQDLARELERLYQLNARGVAATTVSVVKGKPFAASEEQHFLQVLGDGTRIETRRVTRIYRDSEGRTRMEDATPGGQTQPGFEFGPITIIDPVTNTRTTINPQTRQKQTQPGGALRTMFVLNVGDVSRTTGAFTGTVTTVPAAPKGKQGPAAAPGEDLGMKNVNGVMAHGERTVTVIPAAEIGANRDVKVVNERWYSDDLQLLIKSTNTDPRFGDTTYQLTGISQGEQSPSLFQAPADYTEVQGGRGRGRGGAKAKEKDGGPGGRSGGPGPEAVPPPAPPPPGGRRGPNK
jgi:hypothetical protein